MLLPTTIFIFLYLLNLNLADSEIFKSLREMSLLIYLVHPLFIKALSSISKSIGLETYYSANSLVPFVCVTICSVLFSYIVVRLSKRYSLLKAFY
jgi:serine/alanine racemase